MIHTVEIIFSLMVAIASLALLSRKLHIAYLKGKPASGAYYRDTI